VALAKSGRQPEAAQILATARDAIGNDADLALDVAGAYVQIGDPGAARSLLERFAQPPSQPTLEWQIGQARILDRMGADAPLREALDRMASLGPATPEQEVAIGDLKLSLSIRQADGLLAAGQPAQALQVLQGAKPAQSTPAQAARRGYAEARALRALERWDEAAEVYRAILRANPGEKDAELALIETLNASGQRDQARLQAGQLMRAPHTGDPDFSASLAGELIELGDFPGARSLVETTLAASPDHPRALAYAGQLALREGRIDQAIDYLRRSLASEMARRPEGVGRLSRITQLSDPGSPLSIEAAPTDVVKAEREAASGYRYRQLAELLDQETGWVSSALDWRARKGSHGKGQISSQELPLEWKLAWDRGGRWFVRADAARVNAGALEFADSYEASTFGSVLLCQPLCATGTLPQLDKGLALSAGLEREQLRLDLGTSPLGFRVVNVLGGILHKGDLGAYSYSVDASRRSVTSSLLSFAGTVDPNTGRTWGGVVASGVRLGLSRDSGGTYGAWSSLGLHRLSGKNVQDNDRAQLMAGAYQRLINEEDRQFAWGVTGMFWRHSENAGEFTFGHGGYYSPRSYRSLALPLTYGWRTERSSFALRGSVSVAWSDTKGAPYFPTDAGLQAQAEALTPVNGIDPHYASSDGGRSYGRSLAGGWEHQITPGLFIGGRLELERSTNYTPNRFLIYLRLATDRPAARPVPFPPEPVFPSSQY
jgi:tetratricopeptide (TPR) repeat protein